MVNISKVQAHKLPKAATSTLQLVQSLKQISVSLSFPWLFPDHFGIPWLFQFSRWVATLEVIRYHTPTYFVCRRRDSWNTGNHHSAVQLAKTCSRCILVRVQMIGYNCLRLIRYKLGSWSFLHLWCFLLEVFLNCCWLVCELLGFALMYVVVRKYVCVRAAVLTA